MLGVLTWYDPPQPLIIPGMRPGEQKTLSIAVKVSNLDDPVAVAQSGLLSVSYTYVGRYRVTVPAGTYPAALIKWQYHGEVGLAGFKGSVLVLRGRIGSDSDDRPAAYIGSAIL